MGWYQKFCEWGTDAAYVPHGQKCNLCGRKLGFLSTGFWSVNAKHLTDGVMCERCYEKLQLLVEFHKYWLPARLRKEAPFHSTATRSLVGLDVEGARTLMESTTTLAAEEFSAHGSQYTSLFRARNGVFIEPTPLQVGVVRSKQLKNKLVLFGFMQTGQIQKGDTVLIVDGENTREATVLEAYVYDCEENDLEVVVKAHMGKQRLSQWQKGWLLLDDEEGIGNRVSVIG